MYEVADANPSIQETAQFPTFITLPNVTAPAVAAETVSLAPVSLVASASTTAAIVRFVAATAASDCNALGDCGAAYFPKLMVDATPIKISAIASGGAMTTAPGYIPIRNGGGGLLEWNAVINYQTGSGWLFLDYPSGVNSGSVRVWSDTKNLSTGTYQATITINGGSAGSQTIPLTLTVTAAAPVPPPPPPPPPPPTNPSVTVSQVVNAATFSVTPLVAGSLRFQGESAKRGAESAIPPVGSHSSGRSDQAIVERVDYDGAARQFPVPPGRTSGEGEEKCAECAS